MNKRIDKKKQKRTLESAVTATATSSAPATATPVVEIKEVVKEVKVPVEVPAKNPAFYVQYQSAEYTVAAITERVIAECKGTRCRNSGSSLHLSETRRQKSILHPWRVQWIY